MSEHPRPGIREHALSLPARDRLALATELLDSVERADDAEWDAAWLAELAHRAQDAASNPNELEDWSVVRDRILRDLRSK
jgi:hypothetical protein